LFFSTSNKKSSRIGNTVLALITPAICCNCFNKEEDETINFIVQMVWAKLLIFGLQPTLIRGLPRVLPSPRPVASFAGLPLLKI
jgi:hypothetical protein